MSKTRTFGQTRKTKRIPPCEDVDQEFCKRALSLLTSMYEQPSIESIVEFPPVKKTDDVPIEKKVNFNSNIVDLRLRRKQTQKESSSGELNDTIAQKVEEMSKTLKESNVNLDDIFMPEKAPRADVPRYIANIQKDMKRNSQSNRKKNRDQMQMDKIQEEYRERLKKSEQKGLERLERRLSKYKSTASEVPEDIFRKNNEDDNLDYRKREVEKMKTLRERREKQIHFMSHDQYKQLVRPKQKAKSVLDEHDENEGINSSLYD